MSLPMNPCPSWSTEPMWAAARSWMPAASRQTWLWTRMRPRSRSGSGSMTALLVMPGGMTISTPSPRSSCQTPAQGMPELSKALWRIL